MHTHMQITGTHGTDIDRPHTQHHTQARHTETDTQIHRHTELTHTRTHENPDIPRHTETQMDGLSHTRADHGDT